MVSDMARDMRLRDQKAIHIGKLSTALEDQAHDSKASIPALELRTQNTRLNLQRIDMKCDQYFIFPYNFPHSLFKGFLLFTGENTLFYQCEGLRLSNSA